jgi:hypothetical protein
MSEHEITDNITLIDDGTRKYNPENLEVRVGKDLYDWKNTPKEVKVKIVELGIIQELN